MSIRGEVTIEIGGGFAWVTPALESLLGPRLCYTATRFRPGGPLGYEKTNRQVRLYSADRDRLCVPAGLADLVAEALRGAGYRVTILDRRRFGPRLAADWQVLGAAAADDRKLLEAIVPAPRGLMEVSGGADAAAKAALLCRLFPRARVLLPVATRAAVRGLYRQLYGALNGQVHVKENFPWPHEGGRLVCTLQTFRCFQDDDWDLVLFPDVLQAAVAGHARGVLELRHQRVYGFFRQGAVLGAAHRLRLQALCGPVLHRPADPRGRRAEVQVLWCQPPWCAPVRGPGPLRRKREAYWHNDARNDTVADVAAAFTAGDTETLGQRGLFPPGNSPDSGGVTAVTVLVESTEHGQELQRRLPGWELWHASPAAQSQAVMPRDVFQSWSLRRVILTLRRAAELAELLAVIRGLEALGPPAAVRLVTDSEYVALGLAQWLPRWRQHGWRRGSGRRQRPVKNLDLWTRLDDLLGQHEVSVVWVRGHAGHAPNEACDRLARQAAQELQQRLRARGEAVAQDHDSNDVGMGTGPP